MNWTYLNFLDFYEKNLCKKKKVHINYFDGQEKPWIFLKIFQKKNFFFQTHLRCSRLFKTKNVLRRPTMVANIYSNLDPPNCFSATTPLTPYFTNVYITFVNSKSFFKASDKPNLLLTTTFAGYQINNIFTVTLQNSHNFIFLFVSKASKVRRSCSNVLADVTFFVTYFYRIFVWFGSARKWWWGWNFS